MTTHEVDEERLRREMALVTDLVDETFYLRGNPSVEATGLSALEHFCRIGWRELRKPNPDFDVWWYWSVHLDPADDAVNPLVHWASEGREAGLSTRPTGADVRPVGSGTSLPRDRPVRRAVLFAGFDVDGEVDESVVALLRDLSRHGDVFYLFDGYLAPRELDKIRDITVGAWGIRHGAYDFGSYAMLARELVGWDRLAGYDEVLFVNDSCFAVRPLDELFAEMDARDCDWWGLQATKGIIDVRDDPFRSLSEPVALATALREHAEDFERESIYNFHVGSYFLAFRRPVLDDPLFRRLMDSVAPQAGKRLVVHKYEIGLTHLLLGRGHALDTFMADLYPYHPLFSDWAFVMIGRGFPLLKRYFIYQNHYNVPGLVRWKERLLEVAPGADVEQFERTLVRTAPDDRLKRSFAITTDAAGDVVVPEVLRGPQFRRVDKSTVKRPDLWVFAVDGGTHRLPDNSRAILEAVRDDPTITKVVLTRSRRVELAGANVVVEPLLSPAGRDHLLRAGTVFVRASMRNTLAAPVQTDQRAVVMVRDGLQLERAGRAAEAPAPPEGRPGADRGERLVHPIPGHPLAGILVASDVDRLATLATHWPARFEDTWSTGIPAHDFLWADTDALPDDLAAQVAAVEAEVRGRRLLLFAPTQRTLAGERAAYRFTDAEIDRLRAWCERHDAVIGLREAAGDLVRPYAQQLGDLALDLSRTRYASDHAVLRATHAVLTDYSGLALDHATTGRPVIAFAHDLDVAAGRLLYDLEHFFPGPVCRDFDSLEAELETVLDRPLSRREQRVREMLVDHPGHGNVDRVMAHLVEEGAMASSPRSDAV
ncbi:rhamnan synthesis F family protein [Aeromicrobium chenweiae]|uniref:Uncharacterized protein n=1 Tax=Aeromicrobium chenweiae TaxID=2079793 RepID=A0A2S0WK62_9ACTN|nr:rhamnan synthesis F family protein [Aeromicrobium chenweiae]AWB91725.1 hypothetical protein C3E78_05610 [Aeromicrobium chenweiae]TGN32566.1 hypothetical protein E4L97_07570 [Aeromicrobium chenweiae]